MASRAEFGIFAVIAAAGSFGRGDRLLESPKILLAICLLLCGVSGYIAAQFPGSPEESGTLRGRFSANFRYIPTLPLGFLRFLQLFAW